MKSEKWIFKYFHRLFRTCNREEVSSIYSQYFESCVIDDNPVLLLILLLFIVMFSNVAIFIEMLWMMSDIHGVKE